MMYNYGHMGGFGFLGLILTVLFWVVFVWLIVALIRSLTHYRKDNWGHDSNRCHCPCHDGQRHDFMSKNTALDILKERYAKGDISKAEFEEKKKDIM